MASQVPNNTYTSGQGQTQMRRNDILNQPSDIHNQDQGHSFLQETGTQVKHMAQGAADAGIGAAQGAVNIARGAAIGAANMAYGATDAVKHTLGLDSSDTTTTTTTGTTNNATSNTTSLGSTTYPTNPRI
ncbi:hypothetical protein ACJIZ3_025539 [Penstemon smallii]|uniref:Uncharacterized protein n=1 Tax=Penstemon smallii TaxID=265156 RepID=A0ABD3TY79_9LAMI